MFLTGTSATDIESVLPAGVMVFAGESVIDAESVLVVFKVFISLSETVIESDGFLPMLNGPKD